MTSFPSSTLSSTLTISTEENNLENAFWKRTTSSGGDAYLSEPTIACLAWSEFSSGSLSTEAIFPMFFFQGKIFSSPLTLVERKTPLVLQPYPPPLLTPSFLISFTSA